MVFPQNIHTKIARTTNRSALRNNAVILITLLALVLTIFFIIPYLAAFMPKLVATIVTMSVVLGVAQHFIRKYPLREAERMEEYLSRGSESFSKYMGIRNIDAAEFINVAGYRVPVFEFMNGSHAVYLKLEFGRSDVHIAKNTQEAFAAAFSVLGANNLGFSDFTFREKFSEMREGKDLIGRANLVQDQKFRPFITSIYKYVSDLADENANVPEYYLVVTTKTPFQRMELPFVLEKFLEELTKRRTSIRQFEFLDSAAVLKKLSKRFYGLKAIDISRAIVMETAEEESFSQLVQVYKVKKGNKTYTHPDALGIKINATKVT